MLSHECKSLLCVCPVVSCLFKLRHCTRCELPNTKEFFVSFCLYVSLTFFVREHLEVYAAMQLYVCSRNVSARMV